ncbi:hypothetical protein MJI37_30480, partial [Salmonella enterica subsp. enterica serovar Cerro]|nr:hypothetical protein [Salmonella enterica subsp. enterica serovar Cerro]
HWQPSAQGGEMALKTSWDAVPSLFVRLAESEMSVSRFSLRREDQYLYNPRVESVLNNLNYYILLRCAMYFLNIP